MAASESAINGSKQNPPPYVAHRTFINFVNSLTQGIPLRIDKSIISNLAGSTQGQLLATLRYFDLIETDGKPKDLLTKLVNSEGPERQKLFNQIVTSSYDFVFTSELDLQKATTNQVEELFSAEGLQGETRRKAFGFFLALTKDAGIKLSPHIKPPRTASAGGGRRRTARANNSDQIVDPPPPAKPETLSRSQILLSKFPSFDPAWPEEVQKRWFDAFDKLMKTEDSE